MQHRGKVVGTAAWDPIITETEHDAVAAILANPARRTSPGPARRHLLSGLARCAECGAGMKPGWVPTRKGEKHHLYLCPSKQAGHPSRAMVRVDDYVIERALRYLDAVYRDAPETNVSPMEDERNVLRHRQQETAVMFAEGKINAAQLASITEILETKLAQVTEALSEATIEESLPGHSGFTRAEFDALSLDRKRKLIDTVVSIQVAFVNGSRDQLGVTVTPRMPHGRFSFSMPRDIAETLRQTMGPIATG